MSCHPSFTPLRPEEPFLGKVTRPGKNDLRARRKNAFMRWWDPHLVMKAANTKSYPSCRTCVRTVHSTGQGWQLGSGPPVVVATCGMAVCPQRALAAEAAPSTYKPVGDGFAKATGSTFLGLRLHVLLSRSEIPTLMAMSLSSFISHIHDWNSQQMRNNFNTVFLPGTEHDLNQRMISRHVKTFSISKGKARLVKVTQLSGNPHALSA